jgi:signal peptidase I
MDRPDAPRRVWLALLLTLLLSPVVGYLYVGRPRRALAMALASAALLFCFRNGLGGWLATPAGWLTLVVAAFAPLVFGWADVARIAWRERRYRLRKWNRWWVYLIVGVGFELGADAVVDPDLGGFLAVRPFSTPSGSMTPTLNIGDRAVADMRAYERDAPQPGDIVIVDRDGDGSQLWVKRVIAGPGDTVAIAGGVVSVNDAAVRLDALGAGEPPRAIETLANGTSHLIMPSRGEFPQASEMAKITVPADAYFLLGDNRGNSTDSRFADFGFIPRARIVGRMTFITWSSDRRRIGALLP